MRTLTALAVLAAAAPAACGREAAPEPVAPSAAKSERVAVRDARLRPGAEDVVLLRLRGVGRLLISCDDERGPRVAFRASRMLATSDVVVAPAGEAPVATTLQPGRRYEPQPHARVVHQTWHVGEFAAADVTVTVIDVAARALGEPDAHACSASARATVMRQRGPTLTR